MVLKTGLKAGPGSAQVVSSDFLALICGFCFVPSGNGKPAWRCE